MSANQRPAIFAGGNLAPLGNDLALPQHLALRRASAHPRDVAAAAYDPPGTRLARDRLGFRCATADQIEDCFY